MNNPNFYIDDLELKNFRNILDAYLQFSPKVNCILGKNGNGKTSILEAIYYSLFLKSFKSKTKVEQVLNRNNSENFIIKSKFKVNNEEDLLHAMRVGVKNKETYVNNKKSRIKNNHKALIINPFDSFTFYSKSSSRRDWFNHHIALISEDYSKALKNYSKALKMRNSLLSNYKGARENLNLQIKVIDEQLAIASEVIVSERLKFITEIESNLANIFKEMFNEPLLITLKYKSKYDSFSKDEFFDLFQSKIELDLIIKSTKRGPHLDDFTFFIEDRELEDYGSVGQQKISYLSLLFSYVEYLEDKGKTLPILLIDDISGELDSLCWKNLLVYLDTKNLQVIITTANESLGNELSKTMGAKRINVENGVVSNL